MLTQILLLEIQKLRKRKLFLFLVGFLIVILLLLFVGGLLSYQVIQEPQTKEMLKQSLTWPSGGDLSLSVAAGLGGFFLLILTSAVTVSEYNWRTLHLSLSQGVARNNLFLARFLSLMLAAGVFVLMPFILALVLMLMLTPMMGGTFSGNITEVLWLVPKVFWSFVPFVTLALCLSLLTRSVALTNTLSIFYIFVGEPVLSAGSRFLGEPWVNFTSYFPFQLSQSLLVSDADMAMLEQMQINFLRPEIAGLGIFLWGLLFLGLALWFFRQQDLM